MGFTIEVERKVRDEDSTFNELKMRHKECYGGWVGKKQRGIAKRGEWASNQFDAFNLHLHSAFSIPRVRVPIVTKLICHRCGAKAGLVDEEVLEIEKTAVDGQQRTTKFAKVKMSQKA